ncbi:hypothetical protein ACSS6N_18625 [Peribacillus frigoritolerans]|uniref:hypothetical protein n=1 Tax=Peribacillus frigoritolerans TaxID=450367 RepID=UPI003F87ED84
MKKISVILVIIVGSVVLFKLWNPFSPPTPDRSSGKTVEQSTIRKPFTEEILHLLQKDYKTIPVSIPHGSDASKQIQKALNTARDSDTPIKVLLPKGKYTLKKSLHIYSNTWLKIPSKTILQKADSNNDIMLLNGDFKATYHGYNGNSNIIIDGGIWDAGGANIKLRTPSVFGFAHGHNILIRDTVLKNIVGGHAIDLAGNKNVLIRNSKFLGSRSSNDDYTEAIQIDGMISDKAFRRFGSVDFTVTKNVRIEHNYFGNSHVRNMNPWGVGVGSHSASHNRPYTNIQIIDNTFEKMTYAAVRGHNWKDILIKENQFIECAQGIQIDSLGNYYYTKNGKDKSSKGALVIAKFEIHNNDFVDTLGSPIVLYGKTIEFRKNVNASSNSFINSPSKSLETNTAAD